MSDGTGARIGLFEGEPPVDFVELADRLALPPTLVPAFDGVFGKLELEMAGVAKIFVEYAFDLAILDDPDDWSVQKLVSCRVFFSEGREGAIQTLLARHPCQPIDHGGVRYERYGSFMTELADEAGAWSVFWYANEPAWAKPAVDPAAREAAMRELGRYLRDLAPMPVIPVRAHVSIESHNPLELAFDPPIPAPDLAAWLELGDVAGASNKGPLIHVTAIDDDFAILQQPPIGCYRLDCYFTPSDGRTLTDDGAVEVTHACNVNWIKLLSVASPKRVVAKRKQLRFVIGDDANDILDIGRDCVTGKHLPHPVFAKEAVRFAWHRCAPLELWEPILRLAVEMGDRDVYSIAPPQWHEKGVGVYRLNVDAPNGDYRHFVTERAKHGEPRIEWLFGRSRTWGAIVDRKANCAVLGVVRQAFQFGEPKKQPTRISLEDAIQLATSNAPEDERAEITRALIANYQAGS